MMTARHFMGSFPSKIFLNIYLLFAEYILRNDTLLVFVNVVNRQTRFA